MTFIQQAAQALGGAVVNRVTILCPGPGHGRHDRSLSVTFNPSAPDGFMVNSFANDDWQACRDHVRQAMGISSFQPKRGGGEYRSFPKNPRAMEVVPSLPADQAVRNIDFAVALWAEGKPIGGSPVEAYLRKRGIDVPGIAYSGHALRFHSATPFRLQSGEVVRLPAMLGAMTAIDGNALQGVHRTALQPDGSGKARIRGLDNVKMMLGSASGAVVRLAPDEEVTSGLCLSEGIETGLAVQSLGFTNLWCCLSAGTMAKFPLLGGVDALTIFADHDATRVLPNGKVVQPGRDAAHQCAARWLEADRECVVWTPPHVGADFNDVLLERTAA